MGNEIVMKISDVKARYLNIFDPLRIISGRFQTFNISTITRHSEIYAKTVAIFTKMRIFQFCLL